MSNMLNLPKVFDTIRMYEYIYIMVELMIISLGFYYT